MLVAHDMPNVNLHRIGFLFNTGLPVSYSWAKTLGGDALLRYFASVKFCIGPNDNPAQCVTR